MERNQSTAEAIKRKMPFLVFARDLRHALKLDALGQEILKIAVPAALALAADPVASLVDTAFIGHLGAVQIAAVGVAIAIFNQASKVTIYPLVSITTSFVAEETTMERMKEEAKEREKLFKNSETEKSSAADTKTIVSSGENERNAENAMPSESKSIQISDRNLDQILLKNEAQNKVVPQDTADENVESSSATADEKETKIENGEKSSVIPNNDVVNLRKGKEKRHISSASTAMVFGTFLGVLQTLVLILAAKPLLAVMGVKSLFATVKDSPMLPYALKYLTIRALGAPAVLLSLALQGIFRGFKDTTTPLYAVVAGDAANVILDPILIFVFRMGVAGAAVAHVLSQYLMFLILLWALMKQVDLVPPSVKKLEYRKFFTNGALLMTRVIAVTFCVTLAASLAARQGPLPMAAFQVCLQVWLMSSLLADGIAVAGQAILACAFAEKDHDKAAATAARVLQMSIVMGLGLTVIVGAGLYFGGPVFTKDPNVLHLIHIAVPFAAGTQTLNSIAFVFDGVNYGASDFKYAACSMVMVAICTIGSLFALSKTNGYIGIWIALSIYMALRTLVGLWRLGTGTGPWRFLRHPFHLPV